MLLQILKRRSKISVTCLRMNSQLHSTNWKMYVKGLITSWYYEYVQGVSVVSIINKSESRILICSGRGSAIWNSEHWGRIIVERIFCYSQSYQTSKEFLLQHHCIYSINEAKDGYVLSTNLALVDCLYSLIYPYILGYLLMAQRLLQVQPLHS